MVSLRWESPPRTQARAFRFPHTSAHQKVLKKEKSTTSNELVLFGDPYGNRTTGILNTYLNFIHLSMIFFFGDGLFSFVVIPLSQVA